MFKVRDLAVGLTVVAVTQGCTGYTFMGTMVCGVDTAAEVMRHPSMDPLAILQEQLKGALQE